MINKIAITILAIVSLAACNTSVQNTNVLSSQEFSEKLAASKNAVVLDVRTPEEFAMGHIANAKNINVNSPTFRADVTKISKDAEVFVYCKSGSRSATAIKELSELGYTQLWDLDGGVLKWESDNYQLANKRAPVKKQYSLEQYNDAVSDQDKIVLVDFYADWCGPCRRMAPHIETVKDKFGDKLKVVKVNTDLSPDVSSHFKVSSIPLVIMYKNGEEVYNRPGYHSAQELEELLTKNL